jgi:predicted naringenin-chalcone synthase
MILQGLHNVCPPHRRSQRECFDLISTTQAYRDLRPMSQDLLSRVLLGDSGIDARFFSHDDAQRLVSWDAGQLNRFYEKEGPILGVAALEGALQKARWKAKEVDALLVCSCTGYLCPGLSSYVAEKAGLRSDVAMVDIVGQGCGAAIPTLRQAEALLRAGAKRVACVAVEICSAAFFVNNDPGVLISLCLFGDGASASLWSEDRGSAGEIVECGEFRSLHWPQHRDGVRFANDAGKLKNVLIREVPEIAAQAVNQLFQESGARADAILAHPGGRNVIEAMRAVLPQYPFAESAEILRRHGNMSSPSVLFVLEEWLSSGQKEAWMVSFGAGFTCHGCRIRRS